MYQHRKNVKIIMLKVTSVYDIRFSACGEINRNSLKVWLFVQFGKAIAKHFLFSVTEVTVIRKTHSFLLGNKIVKVVCKVSFWYKANY